MSAAAIAAAASAGGGGLPPKTLGELARIRGAIWPKLGLADLPWGPRPGSADNIAMVDYVEVFPPAQQDELMRAYTNGRTYTTAPMGPIVDMGYHGQIPACNWLENFSYYLDVAERWERQYDIRVAHFLRPDAGNLGLEWNVADCERLLTPLFSSPRAQALMRLVCLAWEPGGKYGYNNAWWVEMCAWMARTFPRACRAVHLPPDEDAPVGPADDGHPDLAAWAWGNIAPYIHMYWVQNAGYTDSQNPVPSPAFIREFVKQFDVTNSTSFYGRFQKGYGGWPTTCADWRGTHPYGLDGIVAIPVEYWSYGGYHFNYPAATGAQLGRLAMGAGAIGAFDGGGAAL